MNPPQVRPQMPREDELKRPYPRRDHVHWALRMHTALYEMLNGTARKEEWAELADAINCVEAMCEMGVMPQIEMHYVTQAISGMQEAVKFADGRMRFGAQHSLALMRCVTRWDESLGKFSRLTIDEARMRVIRRIELQKSDPSQDVIVVTPWEK